MIRHHVARTRTVAFKAIVQFAHAKSDIWAHRLAVDRNVLLVQNVITTLLASVRNAEILVLELAEVSVRFAWFFFLCLVSRDIQSFFLVYFQPEQGVKL